MHDQSIIGQQLTSLENILSALEGTVRIHGQRQVDIQSIRYDSRAVQPGDLFVAVNGPDDHAVKYVRAAVDAGASVVVTDAPTLMPDGLFDANDLTLVVVDDARRAMAEMSSQMFDHSWRQLAIYGVTGTNGKTTTTYVLRQILTATGCKVGVIGTLGKMLDTTVPTGYTTPEAPELMAILDEMVRAGLDTVAMEVSSHALALQRVAGLDFAGAVFTNLTQDHLDFHTSMQDYHDAKKLLFDGLTSGRPAVVNVDDVHADTLVRDCHANTYRYGIARTADARIENLQLTPQGSGWTLTLSDRLGSGHLDLHCSLLGSFNVSNVTAAVTLALALDIERSLLISAVAELHAVPGRMESIKLTNQATAVVDYAHTPDALENVLHALRQIGGGGSVSIVFGCGGDRDRIKRPLMGAIAARLADHVIVTSDNPRSEDPETIIREILSGVDVESRGNVRSVVNRAEAIALALDESHSGDIVLIAGKGHEDYQIIGTERQYFDDRQMVRDWNTRAVADGAGRIVVA